MIKMDKVWLPTPDQLLSSNLIGNLMTAISNERIRNTVVNVHWPGFKTEGVPRKFYLLLGDPCLLQNQDGTISFAMLGSYCLRGDAGREWLYRQFLVDNSLVNNSHSRKALVEAAPWVRGASLDVLVAFFEHVNQTGLLEHNCWESAEARFADATLK